MHLFFTTWLLASSALALPQSPPYRLQNSTWIPGSTNGTDKLAREGLKELETYLSKRNTSSTCTLENAIRRKEWDTLSADEKREYIGAVRCLQTKPSISGEIAPGARNRYDDFVATHLNQTLTIHSTGNFLTWHRYFVFTYESALRNECGYTGYQPYINWARLSNSVIDAPIFDGSDTSISGNGLYERHLSVPLPGQNPIISIDPQQGGGCITTGPFKDYKPNIGPVGLSAYPNGTIRTNPRKDGLGYNPRCLRRDLNLACAQGANDANTTTLITQYTDIASFQDWMNGPFDKGVADYGVHTAGHYMVSGDPGGDFYTSPGDPWFWLHHAQIDRVYWIWQNLDLETRLTAIAGAITMQNKPPSRNATLEDRFDLGVNDGFKGMTIGEGLNTMAGPYCYIYE